MGAIFDADSRTSNVTGYGTVFRNFDAPRGMDIADNLATHNHLGGVNL
jgi:hypothetical protein